MAHPDSSSHGDPTEAPGPSEDEHDRAAAVRLPLSCARIVDAAVRYVDHDCLDGLSMRRLGAELGVEAMSLYRYFPSKAALLDAVVCRLLADVALPADPAAADWEEAVRAYASSFRAVCVAHPRLLPLLVTLGPSNPTLDAIDRRMAATWRSAGLPGDEGDQAQAALQGYLRGSCLQGAGTAAGDAAFQLGLDALIVGFRARMAAEGAAAR
jgi:AcrR family transcriptional regulator